MKYKLTARQKIYLPFKRMLDIIFSLLALIIFSILYIVLMIIVKCSSKGPIFFKQDRIGKNNKHFYMYKYRTMRLDAPKDVASHMLEHPERYITKVGRILRKTSLDEIPQAINILKGEMSIVGPRPALYNQEDLISLREQCSVNDIKPGLTGLAQIKGRDTLEIEQKVKYDEEYLHKFNFWFDLSIVFKTIFKAFSGKDVIEGLHD